MNQYQERMEDRAAAVEDAYQTMLHSANDWLTIWWAESEEDGPMPSVAQALTYEPFLAFLRERAETMMADAEQAAFYDRGERMAASREDREAGY